ncbi:hypothetical protein [Pseudomonas sp.]|uniref:hypothetical protein n=1 Tax=Pseudomonas sp. TaxID=306 RepID=UPI0028A6CD0B|nr:hypothetical protein [Pseudomonas sp.]
MMNFRVGEEHCAKRGENQFVLAVSWVVISFTTLGMVIFSSVTFLMGDHSAGKWSAWFGFFALIFGSIERLCARAQGRLFPGDWPDFSKPFVNTKKTAFWLGLASAAIAAAASICL